MQPTYGPQINIHSNQVRHDIEKHDDIQINHSTKVPEFNKQMIIECRTDCSTNFGDLDSQKERSCIDHESHRDFESHFESHMNRLL